jgi:hypothetical protein
MVLPLDGWCRARLAKGRQAGFPDCPHQAATWAQSQSDPRGSIDWHR